MANGEIRQEQDDGLFCRRKKWKKIERVSYITVFVLLVVYSVLSTIAKFTDFNSVAYFVLVVIFSVIMVADVTVLIVSWCKLYRIDSRIADRDDPTVDEESETDG